MTKCLAAYTPETPAAPAMVAYINASLIEGGSVRITVRQQCDDPAHDDVKVAHIDLPSERALDFARELVAGTMRTADDRSFADLRESGGIEPILAVPTDSIERAQFKARKPTR